MKNRMTVLWIWITLLLAAPLFPQERTGNIYGKVLDSEGIGLPGVTVTLAGSLIAPMRTITTDQGNFRFVSLPPARDYCVTAELYGFQASRQDNCAVSVGSNVNINIILAMGGIAEEVTVTAAKVPTVDQKKTSIGQVVSQEILQSLPSARDPWVVLNMSPGVQIDRENVGGSESGQQSTFVGLGGDSDMNNVWTMDGSVITDGKSASSPMYYDFDSFEEMTISVGGNDVTVQTGGVSLNLVTRRGGNRPSLGGRFYLTDENFQSDNLTGALRNEGVIGTNKIVSIKDYGFNAGGPILKDKIWCWLAYGVQDIKGFLLTGANSDALLTNYNFKLNIQAFTQNRLEIHLQGSQKELWGKYASYSYPLGDYQKNKFHFGVPLLKIQDEHTFGNNLFVSARFSFNGSGYNMKPIGNLDLAKIGVWDVTKQQWNENFEWDGRYTPRYDFSILASYFNDKLFGLSQEIKAGFDYSDRNNVAEMEQRSYYEVNWNTPQLDLTGDGLPDVDPDIVKFKNIRYTEQTTKVSAFAAYFSDTISVGHLNIIAGLRFDKQTPSIQAYPVQTSVWKDTSTWQSHIASGVAEAITGIFPPITINAIKPDYSWNVLSPRIGVTWNVGGKNRTIVKFSLAQYGDFMWTKISEYFDPLGTTGYLDFWWLDGNGNGITELMELCWYDRNTYQPYNAFDSNGNFVGDYAAMQNLMWGGYDFENPEATTAPRTTVDPSAKSSRVSEAIAGIEREILLDFGIGLNFTYRKYDRFTWTLDYFPDTEHALSQSDYVPVGTIPSTVGGYSTGEAAGRPYYLLSASYGRTSNRLFTRQPDRYNTYAAVHLTFDKRLSNKWMLNGSFTLQKQASYLGDEGYVDPTNIWALDGQPYSMHESTSGKVAAYVYSRWLLKFAGLYQLPWGMSVGATLNAREGYMVPKYFAIRDLNAPNSRYQTSTIYVEKFGETRLPTFFVANFKIEKVIKISDNGRIYATVDIFNLFNSAVINRRYDGLLGTYYPHDGSFVPNATNFLANEVLNPRVFRLGVRFQI